MPATYQYEFQQAGTGQSIIVHQISDNGSDSVIYISSPSNSTQDALIGQAIDSLESNYPGIQNMTSTTADNQQSSATTGTPTNSQQPGADTKAIPPNRSFDTRLIFAVNSTDNSVVYSLDSDNEHPLIDGMVFTDPKDNQKKITGHDMSDDDAKQFGDFFGIPSIMNPNSYINLRAAGGKNNNKFLIDRENQIRWYNANEPMKDGTSSPTPGAGPQGSTTPTVPEIINWSRQEKNINKFPYKYTDFVFCKWWKKIPNNYLITLRRYPFPVNDGVSSGAEARGELGSTDNLKPVATMLSFLGEEPGNKLSSIVGPIETGLAWKDLKSEVWDVSVSQMGGTVNNPSPGLGKFLGFLTSGGEGTKTIEKGPTPPDPYKDGPYANKVIGPLNVITSTKIRDRGLVFKHEIQIVFEYSLRSIGSINTKAAGLDILSNAMLMTSASASFWGGANRYVPNAGFGVADPFLGGASGKAAWMQGNPDKFFAALQSQFSTIQKNLGDAFNNILQSLSGSDPLAGLQSIAKGGAKQYMAASTFHARQTITGLHSLLTGAPVGEWHLCIGSPMNPIMMMGNMVCTNSKVEFSDELGPDDFPTEMKVTITLEHGMPRDRDGIESMFNKGGGRIYSLPKGYEGSFASSSQSPVDVSIPSKYSYQSNLSLEDRQGALHANRDIAASKKVNLYAGKGPVVGSTFGSLYSQGYGYSNSQSNGNAANQAAGSTKPTGG